MVIKDFAQVRDMAKNLTKRTVAVAAAHDEHTLEAVFKANEEGLLDYILVGDAEKIMEIAEHEKHRLSKDLVIDCREEGEIAAESVRLIREGKADFLLKGLMQTSSLLKAVVNKETGISKGGVISHIAFLDIPKYHKMVGVTDGGMLTYPNFDQKKAIVKNAVELLHNFGYQTPKVAALCAVEVINPKMKETIDAAELKKLALQGELGDCVLEGPISIDLAVDQSSVAIKRYESPVAADADILMVPDINVGNITVKALTTLAGAKMAGCVVGAQCPIALNSRGASFEEKYDALLVCSLMSRKAE